MLIYFILLAAFIFPLGLLRGEAHWKLIRWLSPAFWAYAVGILMGLLLPKDRGLLEPFLEGTVALAIPLMLLSADLKAWRRLAGPTLISVATYFPVVLLVALAGQQFMGQPAEAAALAAAVYTGGTANMAAVNVAIGGDASLFGTYNLADLMVGGSLLPIILSFGPRIYRRILKPFPRKKAPQEPHQITKAAPTDTFTLPPLQALRSIGLGAAAIALAAGITFLIMGELHGSLMLGMLTVTGLAGASWHKVRDLTGTYETGEYFFLVFCTVAGAMIDLEILTTGAWPNIGYMAWVILGTMILHTLVSRLLRIDSDTTLITHIAGLYGPPFIGPMATAMHNREIVVTGLTVGVANLALGNLAGLLVWNLVGG